MKVTVEISSDELFDILNSDGPDKKDIDDLEMDLFKKALVMNFDKNSRR
jgi:hypothetical protein